MLRQEIIMEMSFLQKSKTNTENPKSNKIPDNVDFIPYITR